MLRNVLALFLLGVLFFSGVAVALDGDEPEAITRDPLVHDENTYAPTDDGSLYCWISGYASQSKPGYLYNIHGDAGSTGVCELWTTKFSPSTATPPAGYAWDSAQIAATGWCPLWPKTIYAEITWVPGTTYTSTTEKGE
ncbi:hypothetical protein FH039_06670 [Thermococcus indicus]|uniref:Uncharacterized protein n=1 Tax=Thermococcus indicus TaxID=2586643 RepID=A0A4Y5SKN0_9EURY|nr:hypothetical protein [Thermococcus indicus]QDA31345.1 hypothetical protein FH039_06670 [Thermococcus indicus]